MKTSVKYEFVNPADAKDKHTVSFISVDEAVTEETLQKMGALLSQVMAPNTLGGIMVTDASDVSDQLTAAAAPETNPTTPPAEEGASTPTTQPGDTTEGGN